MEKGRECWECCGLNILLRHRLAGLRADSFQHVLEFGGALSDVCGRAAVFAVKVGRQFYALLKQIHRAPEIPRGSSAMGPPPLTVIQQIARRG